MEKESKDHFQKRREDDVLKFQSIYRRKISHEMTNTPHQHCKTAPTAFPWAHPLKCRRYTLYVPTHCRRRPG